MLFDLGREIAKRRMKLGMSQEELADKSGVATKTIYKIENDSDSDPRWSTLVKICNALDTDMSDLIETSSVDSVKKILKREETEVGKLDDMYYGAKYKYGKIYSLPQFMIILPLVNPNDIREAIYRVGGDIIGNEEYIVQQLSWCYEEIPDSPEKRYADYLLGLIEENPGSTADKILNLEFKVWMAGELSEEHFEERDAYCEHCKSFGKYYRKSDSKREKSWIEIREEILRYYGK
ncbi:MAG: helix-turn-helix transcriptional regulator [Lachnospiraceae bacterium]|nr:helix-turn-helix transcriptional regulator [Lachnospiraceae bacterium]